MDSNRNSWKSGTIVDCFDDIDVCVVTVCLPCLVFSENRSTLHGGPSNPSDEGIDPCLIYCLIMSLSACTLQCLYAYSTRTDIRRKYNLNEEPCDDCLTHICCHCCALCQEHRELRMYPLTHWPLPANQTTTNTASSFEVPRYPQVGRFGRRRSPGVGSGNPYGNHQYSSSVASSSVPSNVPLTYAHAHYPSIQPGTYSAASAHGSPYSVPGGSYYPMNQFPASPPRAGPPQPLVYETHRMPASYGGQILPGIPAHVYQVPKFPDMNRGNPHQHPPAPPPPDPGNSGPPAR